MIKLISDYKIHILSLIVSTLSVLAPNYFEYDLGFNTGFILGSMMVGLIVLQVEDIERGDSGDAE